MGWTFETVYEESEAAGVLYRWIEAAYSILRIDDGVNKRQNDCKQLLAKFLCFAWGHEMNCVFYRNDEERRRLWTKFWTGYGFGDIDLVHRVWDDANENGEAITEQIMGIMDIETIRDAIDYKAEESNIDLALEFVKKVWRNDETKIYRDRNDNEWTMLWMATALNKKELYENAWKGMSEENKTRNIWECPLRIKERIVEDERSAAVRQRIKKENQKALEIAQN